MKKLICMAMIATACVAFFPQVSQAKVQREPGGIGAFIVGCCWGIRCGTEWNEGADMHWREWIRIVPYVNIIFMIWDGVDCANGMTAHEWAKKNAANWY